MDTHRARNEQGRGHRDRSLVAGERVRRRVWAASSRASMAGTNGIRPARACRASSSRSSWIRRLPETSTPGPRAPFSRASTEASSGRRAAAASSTPRRSAPWPSRSIRPRPELCTPAPAAEPTRVSTAEDPGSSPHCKASCTSCASARRPRPAFTPERISARSTPSMGDRRGPATARSTSSSSRSHRTRRWPVSYTPGRMAEVSSRRRTTA